jgi:flagellar operon protein
MNKITPAVNNGSLHKTHERMSGPGTASPASGWTGKGKGFAEVLKDQQVNMQVKLSAHAQERLKQQNISISSQDIDLISNAVQRAEKKGSRESLMLLRDLALVVSINNRTVITAVDKTRQKERIFTNIDSTVIL